MDLVPGWPRASVNLALAANATRSGTVSIGDVWRVGDTLSRDPDNDPSTWVDAWSQVADEWRERADDTGDARSRLRQGYALLIADRLMPDGADREDQFRVGVSLISGAIDSFDVACERVSIPYGGSDLPGIWMPGRSDATVVFFPGLDTTKEIWLALAGPDLARTGVNVLFLDGPGQGEALRVKGLILRHDVEVVLEAALDWLATKHRIAPARTVVLGASFGGYLAGRAAARVRGLAGSIIWGAVWDYHAVWQRRLDGAATAPVDFSHICRMTGVGQAAAAVERLRPFTLDGIAGAIVEPTLVLHGALDAQVPLSQAHQLIEAISAEDRTLIVFDRAGTGAAHVQVDNLAVALDRITTWLRERLHRPTGDICGK